jgi:hypothetical protein
LLETYSPAQLEEGLDYLTLTGRLRDFIWDPDLPWEPRRACLRAMVPLAEQLFARDPLGETAGMWWNWLRYFGPRPADSGVKDTLLDVLTQILQIPSSRCWGSALHGLGHLEHPGKRAVIEAFLTAHPELDDDWRAYASSAVRGEVL